MKRRGFIKYTSLSGLGILSSPLLYASCEKENIVADADYQGKILIIGAGAAGLYAGFLLKQAGIDFQILEASNLIGGRMGKLEGFAEFPLDLGAQWLHGKKSLLGDMIKKEEIAISKDNSELYFWYKNRMRDDLPRNLMSLFEEEDLPDISFADYAAQQGLGEDYKYIVEAIAGDQGADASRISAYWNIKEEEDWSSGEEDYKFEGTFFDVLNEQIVEPIKSDIILNAPVKSIEYEEAEIRVVDRNGQIYQGDKVLVTVPIPILKEGSINFSPPLAEEKINAFKKIGMDAGMKVFLKFKDNFYNENIIGGKFCAAYADEKEGKKGNDHVLLAFIMGEQAEYLSSLNSDDALVDVLLEELDEMYNGQASNSYLESHVQDFSKMPFIKGAYSYSTIGIGNARKLAAESVNDKIFFAGEAMNLNGHHQTVHGAMESGEHALKFMLF